MVNHERALALVLWKLRHQYPGMSIRIEQKDVQALEKCEEHLEVKAGVAILGGSMMHVNLVCEGTQDAFTAVESTEEDQRAAERARRLQQAKESIPELVTAVKAGLGSGEFSQSNINDLADAAMLLVRS